MSRRKHDDRDFELRERALQLREMEAYYNMANQDNSINDLATLAGIVSQQTRDGHAGQRLDADLAAAAQLLAFNDQANPVRLAGMQQTNNINLGNYKMGVRTHNDNMKTSAVNRNGLVLAQDGQRTANDMAKIELSNAAAVQALQKQYAMLKLQNEIDNVDLAGQLQRGQIRMADLQADQLQFLLMQMGALGPMAGAGISEADQAATSNFTQ